MGYHQRARERWAHNREALARALDVVLPPSPFPWTSRAKSLVLDELDVLALGRASTEPITLWAVRQHLGISYVCLNQLVLTFGEERLIAVPPGDDESLPAFRCPPLDGSCPLPALQEGERREQRLETLQAQGLFESVPLAPRFHALLQRRRAGPRPSPMERAQILSLLFVLRSWEATNRGMLRHVSVHDAFDEVSRRAQEDMRRPPDAEGVVQFEVEDGHHEFVLVRCFPQRLQQIQARPDEGAWISGFAEQWLAHDTQVGGRTEVLWYCRLFVDDESWRLERTLLWRREEHGMEKS